jgi:hypothetical protein
MSDSEHLHDRRSLLVTSAATLAAGTLLGAEGCAQPAADPAAQLTDFVALSSVLLGVAVANLAPENDSTGVKNDIFAAAKASDERLLAQLLQTYRGASGQSAENVASLVLQRSGSDLGFFAKSVMLAWLLGSWYDPATLQKAAAQVSPGFLPSSVISAGAYREAWAWKIGQTKAMGTTVAGFGYWTSTPPSLQSFLGGSR